MGEGGGSPVYWITMLPSLKTLKTSLSPGPLFHIHVCSHFLELKLHTSKGNSPPYPENLH